MNWRQSPLLFSAWLVSLGLLIVFAFVLIPTIKVKQTPQAPLVITHEKPKIDFPDNFGSLVDLVPFSGAASFVETNTVSVPEVAHADEYRDEAWLKAQPAQTYTIQVLAVQDETGIKRYLDGRADRSQFDYFQQIRDGQAWYILIFGRYPSLELARGVTETTDFAIASRPFAKAFQAYQEVAPSTP